MASGKQSKRLRRAAQAAPPPVRAKGRGRQASPRVLLGAAALLVLVVLAVVVAFALTGGSDSSSSVPARGSLENALPGAGEVEQLLKGIPQQGDRLGSASAPATLVEYVDLQCPYCQQLETEAMPELIRRYVRTGKAKIELRPIAFVGPDSQTGRDAVIAAGRQNKLFNVAQLLYVNQGAENTGWLSDEMVRAVAASIPGLDVPRLLDDRNSSETDDEAGSYDTLANKDRIQSTPTILVGKTGRTPRLVSLASPTDGESIAAALDAALR
jgi:protein-disulfide isomerase